VRPQEYAKAIGGAVLAGLGALYLALSDGSVSAQEWVGVAQTSLAAFAVVWGVPNAPKKDTVEQKTVTVETSSVSVSPAVAQGDTADLVVNDGPVNGL
jgi:hypothetical protein